MSDPFVEPNEMPVAPKKNKGGRPRKAPDLSQVVKDLQDQIAVMQKAQLATIASNADKFEAFQQQATLAPVPEASKDQPPGTYVQVGVDASGSPILRKVRWTKQLIDETYMPKTFVPMKDFTCGPHGIIYRVEPGKETTVPMIVWDLYMESLRVEKEMQDRYKPWTASERAEIDARAAETPGVGVKSRLARVGAGLNVHAVEQATAANEPAK